MPALDLIKPNVKAMRVIANVSEGFARQLKLPSHIRSLGLITADSDDVTYIAADEATKQAQVEVVFGRSLYAAFWQIWIHRKMQYRLCRPLPQPRLPQRLRLKKAVASI